MLFGFAVVPYTMPNAASDPNRTKTWSPPPKAAVAPRSSMSRPFTYVAAWVEGLAKTAARPVTMKHKATRIAFVCMWTVLRSGPRLAGDLLNPSVRNSFSISWALKGELVAGSPVRRDRDRTGENVLTGRPIRAPVQRRPLGRT